MHLMEPHTLLKRQTLVPDRITWAAIRRCKSLSSKVAHVPNEFNQMVELPLAMKGLLESVLQTSPTSTQN